MTPAPIVDPVIQAWCRQLIDLPALVSEAIALGQVEVRLRVNKGRVRAHPTVILNAGQQDLRDPAEAS